MLYLYMSRDMRFPTMPNVGQAKPQISISTFSLIRTFASHLNILRALTEHDLEILSLKRGDTGSSESTKVLSN